jgi:hypothetical protein
MLIEAYRQFTREERRRWLVCGTATVILLCWLVNAFVLDLQRRHSQLEHARGMTKVGGWFE